MTIDNCVITDSNRGIAFMTFDGGAVENVVLSNLVIETVRYDWFWWGDGEPFHFNIRKRSEVHANWPKDKDRPAGAIRNVKIQNVIARGYGMSVCNGHPDSWLDGVSFENVKLTIAHDPKAPYDKAVDAIRFELARNLRLRDFEVVWEKPLYDKWRSACHFRGRPRPRPRRRLRPPGPRRLGRTPAIVLRRVEDAVVRGLPGGRGHGHVPPPRRPGDARRRPLRERLPASPGRAGPSPTAPPPPPSKLRTEAP